MSRRIVRPLRGRPRISSVFGAQECFADDTCRGEPHNGTDYAVPIGTPLLAPADGRIFYVLNDKFNGRGVGVEWLDPDGGLMLATLIHLSRVDVRKGQVVKRGQVIGATGNTGKSKGPHLHFTLRRHGIEIDPEPYMVANADPVPVERKPPSEGGGGGIAKKLLWSFVTAKLFGL